MRALNALAAMTGAILCVVALLVLGGCADIGTPHGVFNWHLGLVVTGLVLTAAATVAGIVLGIEWIVRKARPDVVTRFMVYWFPILCLVLMFVAGSLSGCAALPMPFQPATQENSNYAEGTFVVLATVDTLQTVQIAKHPTCYYERDPLARALYGTRHPSVGKVIGINALMITAHTMVASFLDDKVAEENALYDAEDKYGVGPWYGARFVFHAVSLLAEGSATINNWQRGIRLTSTGCPR